MSNPPAGWYPDPTGQPDTIRWWNGKQWTNRTDQEGAAEEPAAPVESTEVTEVQAPVWGATASGGGGSAGSGWWTSPEPAESGPRLTAVANGDDVPAGGADDGAADDGMTPFERARATWGAPELATAPPEHWTQRPLPEPGVDEPTPDEVSPEVAETPAGGWKLRLAPAPASADETGDDSAAVSAAGSWGVETGDDAGAAEPTATVGWGVEPEPTQEAPTWGGESAKPAEVSTASVTPEPTADDGQGWSAVSWTETPNPARKPQPAPVDTPDDEPTQVQSAWGVDPELQQTPSQQTWGVAASATPPTADGWGPQPDTTDGTQPDPSQSPDSTTSWGTTPDNTSQATGTTSWGVQSDNTSQAAEGGAPWGAQPDSTQQAGASAASSDSSTSQASGTTPWGAQPDDTATQWGASQQGGSGWDTGQQGDSGPWGQTAVEGQQGGPWGGGPEQAPASEQGGPWGGAQQAWGAEAKSGGSAAVESKGVGWGAGPAVSASGGGQRGGVKKKPSGGGGGGSGAKLPLMIGGAIAVVMLIVAAVFLIKGSGDDKQAGPGDPTTQPTNQPSGDTKPGQSKNPKLHEGERISADAISFPRQAGGWSDRKRLVPQLLNSSGQYVLLQQDFDGRNDWNADIFVGALGNSSGFGGDPKATALQLAKQVGASLYGDIGVTFKAGPNAAVERSGKSGWFVQQTVTATSPKIKARTLTLTVAVFDLGDGTAVAYISDIPTTRPDLKAAETKAYQGLTVG
ncbi:DUF2510 domain-containing protein [Kribbella sandramycini]|uniref:DUF2510 domain-containing protein n=1 Tax=Kribbella sandramycini TaxID=60450 RepID=A0A7Y4KUM1_9ACTN|nr:DUF2510 domain-containing protein [Kribbella sandramycini]MBB6568488.1 hypothetical protein [Kribbella sandramycini]NOL38923.1 DUF2510 domain-containing protein [Kribbella sandramycini]